jgi:hypothetical protein
VTVTAYDISIPLFTASLTGLSTILDKGERFFGERGIEDANILNARIYPDMFPFHVQVRISTRHPLRVCELLGKLDVPGLAASDVSLPELKASVEETIAFLKSISPEQFAGAEDAEVRHTFRSGFEQRFTGLTYLTQWCLPNFYFHLTTAYDILRGLGVDVTKRDYMGGDLPR